MTTITNLCARFLLWLIGVALPVFIAACYGMPYRFSKQGRVIDAETKQGIPNIMVSCVRAGRDEFTIPSWENGRFELSYDLPCDELRLEDTDGEENGGRFEAKTVPFCESCDEITVEMSRASQ